jgi:hypothetical protein
VNKLVISYRGGSKLIMETIVKSLPNLKSIKLIPLNSISRSDIHIEIDYNEQQSRLIGNFNVLILWEPATVVPRQYTNSILKKFDLIIAMGETRGENLKTNNWAHHPYQFKTYPCNEKLRKKDAVMINSVKFSANKKSLYGFRRKVSRSLNELNINYALIGDNWHMNKNKEFRERAWALRKELRSGNIPNIKEVYSDFFYKYPEYVGRIDDKIKELSKYKYAIIIENEADFVSEKLFDAIAAKCVPIYVGPNLKKYKKLSKCIIPFDPNLNEIVNFFKSNNEKLYLEKKIFINNSANYLSDIKIFSLENTSKKIAKLIHEFLVLHRLS